MTLKNQPNPLTLITASRDFDAFCQLASSLPPDECGMVGWALQLFAEGVLVAPVEQAGKDAEKIRTSAYNMIETAVGTRPVQNSKIR